MQRSVRLIRLTSLFLIAAWSVTSAFAQCDETEVNPSDGQGDDEFGYAVALSGDRLVVGADGDDNGNGSVYLYQNTGGTWVERTKLIASDHRSYSYFGSAVACTKNRIVVGAWLDDHFATDAGSVYVYTATGVNTFAEAKLQPTDGVADHQFGGSVATMGNRVVAGARGDNAAGYAAGAAYVFRLSNGTWVQEAKLISNDIHAFDIFGASVAVGGQHIAVGALGAQVNGVRVGAVYVFGFENGNWVQQAKLIADDPMALDFFGTSVAMTQDGTRIIVGAAADDFVSEAAYVFRREGDAWVQEAKLVGEMYEGFGTSVAISFPYCAVGAPFYDGKGATYFYLFDGTNWNQVNRFEPSDGTFDDSYGTSVAVNRATLASGAFLHKNESGPGAVYLYDPSCTTTGK